MDFYLDRAQIPQPAVPGGAAAFKVNCVQCHGSGAAGFTGYPNLNDDDWLWGGTPDAIYVTLKHGIRYASNPETRDSLMPAFGAGLTFCAHLVRWGERITPLASTDVDLAPASRSALEIVMGYRAARGAAIA